LCLGVSSFLLFAGPARAAGVVGEWYGEGYQPLWRAGAQWLMHLSPGGRYAIEFREYRDCRLVRDQREEGRWDLSRGFRTVTTEVNGRPTRYENDYRVESLTAREFRIVHIATGQEYTERRVAPGFTMPAPSCPTS
jgi:hypothetical protein